MPPPDATPIGRDRETARIANHPAKWIGELLPWNIRI
jgi:hypothetical protein